MGSNKGGCIAAGTIFIWRGVNNIFLCHSNIFYRTVSQYSFTVAFLYFVSSG